MSQPNNDIRNTDDEIRNTDEVNYRNALFDTLQQRLCFLITPSLSPSKDILRMKNRKPLE